MSRQPCRAAAAAAITILCWHAPAAAGRGFIAGTPAPSPDGCASLVAEGVRLAQAGERAGADQLLREAAALCPASAAPLRELAGLRFVERRWEESARLAARALAIDPDDEATWRLLATARFLAGREDEALRAWNQVGEPRIEGLQIDGLTRTPPVVVAGLLDLQPAEILTERRLRHARRRLETLPTGLASRLTYRPGPGGAAHVEAAVFERALLPAGAVPLAAAGAGALANRELRAWIAGPAGRGELWSAAWRWWEQRPRVGLTLAVPRPAGLRGVWQLDAFRARETFAAGLAPAPAGDGSLAREDRRRLAVTGRDWLSAALRVEATAGLDAWRDRGSHVSIGAAAETRSADDRVALRGSASWWVPLDAAAAFAAGGVRARWRSAHAPTDSSWLVRTGVEAASGRAPLDLWPGAGTGHARDPLLRAHPLLRDGVIAGPAFGRTLAFGGLELHRPLAARGPVVLQYALFSDGARAWRRGSRTDAPRTHVDVGAGLRVRLGAQGGLLRVDVARGLRDGNVALSASLASSLGRQAPGRD